MCRAAAAGAPGEPSAPASSGAPAEPSDSAVTWPGSPPSTAAARTTSRVTVALTVAAADVADVLAIA
jgi:hypothetical protein